MKRSGSALVVTAMVLAALAPVRAADVSGSARVSDGPTETDDTETQVTEQRYTLVLTQVLTRFLRLGISYRDTQYRTSSDVVDDFTRSASQPGVELYYGRGNVSANLNYSDRKVRASGTAADFDITSLNGAASWLPHRGPGYSFTFRDETNVADVSVFGRETDTRSYQLAAFHSAARWSARYAFDRTTVDNRSTAVSLDQDRHLVRVDYGGRFLDDTLRFDVDAQLSRLTQQETAPAGTTFFEPVPAREGLSAVDLTPDTGELDPQGDLIDGVTDVPASPPIDIGGNNTFRNVGLDLGITRPVARLEVSVDRPSDPLLPWRVYRSNDNLTWTQVAGVTAIFDVVLLRYQLEFPEITDRYFKTVNIGANASPNVLVTEIRALQETDMLGRSDAESTTYRLNTVTTWQPHERVTARFGLSANNDEAVGGGVTVRDFRDLSYDSSVRFELTEALSLRTAFRVTQFEERPEPVFKRNEKTYEAALDWTPMPTLDVLLLASERDESADGIRVRSSDVVRLRARTDVLPGLRLVGELGWDEIDDPFAGFRTRSWRLSETLDAVPTPHWTIGLTASHVWYDAEGNFLIDRRFLVSASTMWLPVPYVSLSADLTYNDDSLNRSLGERYSVGWSPGPKLSVNASRQSIDSEDRNATTTSGANLTYRLNRHFAMFASLTDSEYDAGSGAITKTTSARIGFVLIF